MVSHTRNNPVNIITSVSLKVRFENKWKHTCIVSRRSGSNTAQISGPILMKFGVINLHYILLRIFKFSFNLINFKGPSNCLLLYQYFQSFFIHAVYRKRHCEREKIDLEVLMVLHFSYPLPHYENAVLVCRLCVYIFVCMHICMCASLAPEQFDEFIHIQCIRVHSSQDGVR